MQVLRYHRNSEHIRLLIAVVSCDVVPVNGPSSKPWVYIAKLIYDGLYTECTKFVENVFVLSQLNLFNVQPLGKIMANSKKKINIRVFNSWMICGIICWKCCWYWCWLLT